MNSNERREQADAAAAAWVARRDCDGWSKTDEATLAEWIGQSPHHRVAWLRLSAAWEQTRRLEAVSGLDWGKSHRDQPSTRWSVSQIAGKIRGRNDAIAEPGHRWTRTVSVAASGLLCLVVVSWFWLTRDRAYHTEIGAMTAVSLTDGSRITLNTDTQIQAHLSDEERRVQLVYGESYFQVAKDKSRPFIVASGGSRVVAVGTQFGVRRDGNVVHVYVTEGKVRIEPDSEGSQRPAVQLVAGDMADIRDDNVIVHSTSVDQVEQLLSWRQGYLYFDRTTLADAVAEFNRYNHRKILIEDPAIAAIRISGYFRPTNSTGFAHLVGADFPVTLTEDPDRIVITAAMEKPR
jgi:transmembrane sensor